MRKKILHLFFSKFLFESRLHKSLYFSHIRNSNLEQFHVAILTKKGIAKLNYDLPQYVTILPGLSFDFKSFNRTSRIHISIIYFINYFVSSFIYLLLHRPKIVCIHNPELLLFVPVIKLLGLITKTKICYEPHELEVHKYSLVNKKLFSYSYFFLELIFSPFCDLVVLVTKPIEDWYKKNYKLYKTLIIPNIPCSELRYFRGSHRSKLRSYNSYNSNLNIRSSLNISKDKIIFLYQGAIDNSRGVNELVEIFSKMKNKKGVLVVMGYGDEVKNLLKVSTCFSNIYYHPPVDSGILINFSSTANFGLNIGPKNSDLCLSYKYAMGNKFYEYLMSGLQLIITSNLVYQAQTVIDHELGFVVDSDKKDISNLINNILNNEKEYTYQSEKRLKWVNSLSYKKYFNVYADYLDI